MDRSSHGIAPGPQTACAPLGRHRLAQLEMNLNVLARRIPGARVIRVPDAHADLYVSRRDGRTGGHAIRLLTLCERGDVGATHDPAAWGQIDGWSRAAGFELHTLFVDDRNVWAHGLAMPRTYSGYKLWYFRGSGQVQLEHAQHVMSYAELGRLLDADDEELPAAAAPRSPIALLGTHARPLTTRQKLCR